MAEIESVVVSRSGTEYPRAPPLCEEALQERELVWARLPKTIYQGTISCLSVRDCLNLDSAMINTEARPHLVKALNDMVSPAFNQHVYTDEEYELALRCVKREIKSLRGLRAKAIAFADDEKEVDYWLLNQNIHFDACEDALLAGKSFPAVAFRWKQRWFQLGVASPVQRRGLLNRQAPDGTLFQTDIAGLTRLIDAP